MDFDKIVNAIKIVPRYWITVFLYTFREAKDIRSSIKGGFMRFFETAWWQLVFLLLAIFGISGLPTVQESIEKVSDNWHAFLYVFFTSVLYLLINWFVYFPAKLYFDTKKEAEKFTWNDVSVKKYVFPSVMGNRVGIKVRHDKTISIQKFQPFIGKIRLGNKNIELKGDVNIFPVVKGDMLDDRRTLATFHPGKTVTIELANVRDNEAFITTSPKEDNWIQMKPNIDYYLFVAPNGDAGNEQGKCIFKPHNWEGKISFTKGKLNLKMKNSLGFYW